MQSILIVALVACILFAPSYTFAQTPPIINEVSVHPKDGTEWVELYIAEEVELGTYWLDDDTDYVNDSGGSLKKRLEHLSVGIDEHFIVTELESALFNNTGDYIVLFDDSGNIIDQFQYFDDPGTDMVFGRYPDVAGNMQILEHATKGSANAGPRPTVTSTPEPTAKPTKVPAPTKIPALPKAYTPTKLPTLKKAVISLANGKSTSLDKKKTASSGAYPTAVLGISSRSATIQPTPRLKQVMVKSSNSNTLSGIVFVAGGVLILACGILIFLKRMRSL